jgi:hypothetical protein
MLTLERFESLADSYGASLERWPEEIRTEAEALLSNSQAARAILAGARSLDEAIEAASDAEEARAWPPAEAEAALARLRSRVASRLSAEVPAMAGPIRRWLLSHRALSPLAHPGWGGMVTGGALAIVAGLLTGMLYSSGSPRDVLALLEPAPLQIFSDSNR